MKMFNLMKQALFGFMLLWSLSSCTKEAPLWQDRGPVVEQPSSLNLRGEPISNEPMLYLWGTTEADSLLITPLYQEGTTYHLQKNIKLPSEGAFLSVVSTPHLMRSGRFVMVNHLDQSPFFYFGQEMKGNAPVQVSLARVQSHITFQLAFSHLPSSAIVEEVRLTSPYQYGWVDLTNGQLSLTKPIYSGASPAVQQVGRSWGELSREGVPSFSFYLLPSPVQEIKLSIIIDGVEYTQHTSQLALEPGTNYTCLVDAFGSTTPLVLTEQEKKLGGEHVEVATPLFPDFEFTTTSDYRPSLSNQSAALFRFWLDSRVGEEQELEYKLLIKDSSGNVVSQSPTYGGVAIKPYHYDGFYVPIYIDVPTPSRYKYQLLLRKKGTKAFYEPDQRGDDVVADKEIEIHAQQPVFATRMQLGGGAYSPSTIQSHPLHTTLPLKLRLNNYSSAPQQVKVRAYYYRNPLALHGNIADYLDEAPVQTWNDKIGEGTFTLSPLTSNRVELEVMFNTNRPRVTRFSPIVCTTIEYNGNGVELPLLLDANLLYKYTANLYNPNLLINKSLLSNIAHVQVQ